MSDVEILEAIGYGPDSEISVSQTLILGVDIHSDRSQYSDTQRIKKAPHGQVAFSMERWLRMHFVAGDVAQISLLRFWVPNLAPTSEWDLQMGVASDYRKPRRTQSDIAINAIPLDDPGAATPNVFPIEGQDGGSVNEYSPWIVLQALWFGGTNQAFQSTPLELHFAWEQG